MAYRTSILWALFILACHEHVEAIRNKMAGGSIVDWATAWFKKIAQSLPVEQRSIAWMKSAFKEYLYDGVLDSFLVGIYL